MCNKSLVVGIDPGDNIVGMSILNGSGAICEALNLEHPAFWLKMQSVVGFSKPDSVEIVVEDLAPYRMMVSQQVIDTAKFIGELTYRVKRDYPHVNLVLIKRSGVQNWAFSEHNGVVGPLVAEKIDKKLFSACELSTRQEIRVDSVGRRGRKGSFIYVDDRILKKLMVGIYQIPKPAPGAAYIHGLKDHSWQALAVATCYMHKKSGPIN